MVVIGGDLGEAGDLLLDPLRESMRRDALPAAAEDLEVVAGELGERANLLGALALVLMQSEHERGRARRGERGGMRREKSQRNTPYRRRGTCKDARRVLGAGSSRHPRYERHRRLRRR